LSQKGVGAKDGGKKGGKGRDSKRTLKKKGGFGGEKKNLNQTYGEKGWGGGSAGKPITRNFWKGERLGGIRERYSSGKNPGGAKKRQIKNQGGSK